MAENENETLHLTTQLLAAASQLVASIDRKILLIEDTTAHANLVMRAINQQQWNIEHHSSGLAALESFILSPNRIVLLDLSLPDIDGLELLQRILDVNSKAKVIIITSADKVATSVTAMKLGAVDYVVKSDYEQLRDKIVNSIEGNWLAAIEESEKELIQKTRMVELVKSERLSAIETLVRTVCHEVNNPLSEIIATSQLLLNKGISDESNRYAKMILDSSKKVADVVEKLRAVSDEVIEFGGQQIFSIEKHQKD